MSATLEKSANAKSSKKTELGLIPEDWDIKELGSLVLDMKSGLSRKLSNNDIGLPVLRSNNLKNNKVDFADIKYWYVDDPQGSNTSNYFLKDGDILVNFINSLAQIGKCSIFENLIERNVIYTTNILNLRLSIEILSDFFIFNTQTHSYEEFINSIAKPAVNQASFTTGDFKKMLIALPPLVEQKKITNILKTWDEAIVTTEALLVVKTTIFNTVRNKLTQESNPANLREFSLSEISTEIIRKNDSFDAPIMMISSTRGFIEQNEKYDREMAGESLSKYIHLKNGEFAYNKGNSKTYPFGCIFRLEVEQALIPFVYYCFKLNADIEPRFYRHYFESGALNKQLKPLISSSARSNGLLNINRQDFFSCKVPVPPNDYQKKCADFLDCSLEEIKLLGKQLDLYKTQKKSLMQQLLTGKVRVKV